MRAHNANTPESFWDRVDIGGSDDCWPWLGGIADDGYGFVSWKGERWQAHRLAWHLARGPIPAGQCVLHACDCRPCCNDAHLWPGTRQQNNRDRDAKWRQARGEGHGRARLTTTKVLAIRRLEGTASQAEIGVAFNIGRAHVSRIHRRVAWAHVPEERPE